MFDVEVGLYVGNIVRTVDYWNNRDRVTLGITVARNVNISGLSPYYLGANEIM